VFLFYLHSDTLGKTAQKMYGGASKYRMIFKANTPMLKHPDKIYPG
jgi:nucleoid-associated protein YgaU